MTFAFSRRAASIAPSETLEINARAKELAAAGRRIINLSVGEPEFASPERAKQAGIAAIRADRTRYTPSAGIPELRRAAADWLAARYGVGYLPEEVMISSGAKECLYNLMQVLVDEGDEVVLIAPFWVSYPAQVALAGGRAVIVPTRLEDGYHARPEELHRLLSPRTRAVIINSPSNPAGVVYDRGELLALLGPVAERDDVAIIADDIYSDIVFAGRDRFVSPAMLGPRFRQRTMLVHGVSKSFAMTGWRIGILAGDAEIVRRCSMLQGQSTTCAASVSQWAAVAALDGYTPADMAFVETYRLRSLRFCDRLERLPGLRCQRPEGAFYVMVDISDFCGPGRPFASEAEAARCLLDRAGVACVPGSAFGAPGTLRFSIAADDADLDAAADEVVRLFSSGG